MVVSISPFQHMKGKPDIKYVANIHGNEAVGREMSLHLIEVCKHFINIFFSTNNRKRTKINISSNGLYIPKCSFSSRATKKTNTCVGC